MEESDEESRQDWMRLVVESWDKDLSDPREDIYTLEDGAPVEGELN